MDDFKLPACSRVRRGSGSPGLDGAALNNLRLD